MLVCFLDGVDDVILDCVEGGRCLSIWLATRTKFHLFILDLGFVGPVCQFSMPSAPSSTVLLCVSSASMALVVFSSHFGHFCAFFDFQNFARDYPYFSQDGGFGSCCQL